MKMAYNEDFRALASVAINEAIEKGVRDKAVKVMSKIIDLMEKSTEIETKQTDDFLSRLKSNIEVVKG